jgi:hypothetical protein
MGSGQSTQQTQQKQELKPLQSEKISTTLGNASAAFLRPIRTVSSKPLTDAEIKRIDAIRKHRGL